MKKIRIIIVDDHMLLRQTWSLILNHDSRFEVIAEAGSAEKGIELCRQLRPDVVMLDINLPAMNGLTALPFIRKYAPGTKVLGVSMHNEPAYAKEMIKNGAMGYITKNSSREEMVNALLEVHNQKKFICREIKNILSNKLLLSDDLRPKVSSLSIRELEIVNLVKKGLSSKEIAASISRSVKTVEVHRYNILKKLNLRNTAEMVNHARHYQNFSN